VLLILISNWRSISWFLHHVATNVEIRVRGLEKIMLKGNYLSEKQRKWNEGPGGLTLEGNFLVGYSHSSEVKCQNQQSVFQPTVLFEHDAGKIIQITQTARRCYKCSMLPSCHSTHCVTNIQCNKGGHDVFVHQRSTKRENIGFGDHI
jgi:hypothetical protein